METRIRKWFDTIWYIKMARKSTHRWYCWRCTCVNGDVSPIVLQTALDYTKDNNLPITTALNEVSAEQFHSFWNQQALIMQTLGHAITEYLPDNNVFDLIDDLTEYRGYFDDKDECLSKMLLQTESTT